MSKIESNLIRMKWGGRNIFMRRMTNLTIKEWQELDKLESEVDKAMKAIELCLVKSDDGVVPLFENMTLEEFGQFVEEWSELQETESALDG